MFKILGIEKIDLKLNINSIYYLVGGLLYTLNIVDLWNKYNNY